MADLRRRLSGASELRRWLTPGIGITRWLAVVFLGELGLAFGLAFVLRQVYRDVGLGEPVQSIVSAVTLQFLPYWLRAVILASLGVAVFAFAAWKVVRVLTGPYRSDDEDRPLVAVIYQRRFLARGPRVVALGGGTGLSNLLRGLKEHTSNLTAVVTVADDGVGVPGEVIGGNGLGNMNDRARRLSGASSIKAQTEGGSLLTWRVPLQVRSQSTRAKT